MVDDAHNACFYLDQYFDLFGKNINTVVGDLEIVVFCIALVSNVSNELFFWCAEFHLISSDA